MLDTRFPRPLGDIGNPESFAVPTRKVMVLGAFPEKVVQTAAGMRANKIAVGFAGMVRQLERDGAAAITTSCGFLVLLQKELQAAVKVPVVTSSLLQLPELLAAHKQVGVLTISAARLGHEHLRAAGVRRDRLADVLVEGVDPKGEFSTAILGNKPQMDLEKAQAGVVAAAVALKRRAPALSTVVLECTNMPPYAAQIEQATGMKTFSLLQSKVLLAPFEKAMP
ncbi:MAG: aspartate/glutamate racemase family protein [Burkholderiales bacterium]|nr:aspartate/glutamate racemase family protein [Burkholderiales bacterium]